MWTHTKIHTNATLEKAIQCTTSVEPIVTQDFMLKKKYHWWLKYFMNGDEILNGN